MKQPSAQLLSRFARRLEAAMVEIPSSLAACVRLPDAVIIRNTYTSFRSISCMSLLIAKGVVRYEEQSLGDTLFQPLL